VLQQYFTLISVQNRGRGEIGRERKKNKAAQMIFIVFANLTKKISRKKDVFIGKKLSNFLFEKKNSNYSRNSEKLEIRKKSSVRKKICKNFHRKRYRHFHGKKPYKRILQ